MTLADISRTAYFISWTLKISWKHRGRNKSLSSCLDYDLYVSGHLYLTSHLDLESKNIFVINFGLNEQRIRNKDGRLY